MWGLFHNQGDRLRTLAVGQNADGRLEVFGTAGDDSIWHTWQTEPGGGWGWSGWGLLHNEGDRLRTLAVGQNADGRLEVFGVAGDQSLWHTWQKAPNRGWSGWGLLHNDGDRLRNLVVARNADGRLEVFGTAGDDSIWHTWQTEPGSWPTAQLFVRREIWELEKNGAFDPITLAYANAVKVMQARPATDPTSWTFQAAIHGAYAAPPPGADWNQCQHQGWFFLPWHRMYLYFFERIVRAAVIAAGGPADFAIPYWNYDKPFPGNTIPIGLRTQTLPDGTANPLFLASPRRRASLMSGAQLSASVTSPANALAQTNFTSPAMGFGGGKVGPQHFGNFSNTGALEQTPHNDIHVALVGAAPIGQCQGGFMIDPNCSALDPVFWLHHANIDRLWNVWLASGGDRVNPPDSSWRTAPFVFYDETGAEVTMTAEQVLDSASQLGYVYDDVTSLGMESPPPEGVPEPAGPPELAAATEESFTLAGGSASVPISVPADTQEILKSAAAPGAGRVLVSVDDIKADINPGVVYGVHLNLPDEDGDRHKHHIGNVSLFGIEKMNDPDTRHDGAPGFRHIFDATDVAGKLVEAGLWDPSHVTVTFEPVGVSPPPGEEDTWDAEETEESAVPPIEIGRISLFVA